MRKLLVIALCTIPLMATTVYAQGSTPSPLGSTAGDARGPGKSNANVGGASGEEVVNKLSNEVKGKKDGKYANDKAAGQSKKHNDSYRKQDSESPEMTKGADIAVPSTTNPSSSKTPKIINPKRSE